MTCPDDFQMVDERIDRILTQYRESPKLLHMFKTYLRQAESAAQSLCEISSTFNLETSTDDQLTILGKRLGWPRCHCICDTQPVFGFECGELIDIYPITGFCDDSVTWGNCGEFGTGDICINDDEIYRKFLKVRVYQIEKRYSVKSLNEALKVLWGDQASMLTAGQGKVIVTPGRELSDAEIALLQLYPRVLPIAPGIEVLFHFGPSNVFGFGEGWGEFCNEGVTEVLPLHTDLETDIDTDESEPLIIDTFERSAPWMCQVDVRPYEC